MYLGIRKWKVILRDCVPYIITLLTNRGDQLYKIYNLENVTSSTHSLRTEWFELSDLDASKAMVK